MRNLTLSLIVLMLIAANGTSLVAAKPGSSPCGDSRPPAPLCFWPL